MTLGSGRFNQEVWHPVTTSPDVYFCLCLLNKAGVLILHANAKDDINTLCKWSSGGRVDATERERGGKKKERLVNEVAATSA